MYNIDSKEETITEEKGERKMRYFKNGYADYLMGELEMVNPGKCIFLEVNKEGLLFRVLDPLKWAKEVLDKYLSKTTLIMVKGRTISCILEDRRYGTATCSNTDTFVYDIGLAIALSRAHGLNLPRGL